MKSWLGFSIIVLSLAQLAGCDLENRNISSLDQKDSTYYQVIKNSNTERTINKDSAYNLTIDGNFNKVTIEKNNTIDNLIINGSNNEIIISELSLLSNIELNGAGNTLFFDGESAVSIFTVSGTQHIISVPRNSQIKVPNLSIENVWQRHSKHEITGAWQQFQKENETLTCLDKFTLNTDGTFNYQSGDNILQGTYKFQNIVINNTRHKLELSYNLDNGLPNCKNERGSKNGTTIDLYVLFFDYAPGFMDMYDNLNEIESETPFITFTPLIP